MSVLKSGARPTRNSNRVGFGGSRFGVNVPDAGELPADVEPFVLLNLEIHPGDRTRPVRGVTHQNLVKVGVDGNGKSPTLPAGVAAPAVDPPRLRGFSCRSHEIGQEPGFPAASP